MSANLEQDGNVVVFDHNSILSLLRKSIDSELSNLGNVESVTLHQGRGKKVLENIQCRISFSKEGKSENSEIVPVENAIIPDEILLKPIHPIATFLNSRVDEVLNIDKCTYIPEGFVYVWQVLATCLYVAYDKSMILELISPLKDFNEDDFIYSLRCSIKKFIRETMGYIFPNKEHELEVFGFCSEDEEMSFAIKNHIIYVVPKLCASFTSQPSG